MELVADYVGIMLMASAGYDPREIIEELIKCEDFDSEQIFFTTDQPSIQQEVKYLRKMIIEEAIFVYEQLKNVCDKGGE